MRFLRLAVFAAAVSMDSQLPADPPHALRNHNALVLEGIASIDHASVRNALHANFDLIVASRPNTPLAEYLKKLESVLAVGLEHSGFPSAKVAASYDTAREKIIVRVAEGPRHFCDEVKVTGAGDELARAIAQSLTTADEPDKILWRKDHAAPHDELTREAMQRQVAAALASAGYLAADCNLSIEAAPEPKLATLVVAVRDLGPRAEIGDIVVSGCQRDDAAHVLRHLDLRSGQPMDGKLGARIREQLLSTGRYLACEVAPPTRNDFESRNGREVHDLTINLREFAFAPPLDEPLSPEEQALLRVADWAARWQRDELPEDLVLTAALAPAPNEVPGEPADLTHLLGKSNLRMVVAPRRGTILTVQSAAANERPAVDVVLASLPDRLLLASPSRNAKLELPHNGTVQLQVSAEVAGRDPALHEGRPFALTCGVNLKSVSPAEGSPLQLALKLQPAALLALLQDEQIQCQLEEGLLVIRRPNFQATIEAATGKPVEIVWTAPDSGSRLSIAAVPGVLAAQQRQIDERLADAESEFDPTRPWQSACCFVLDDVTHTLEALARPEGAADSWRQTAATCRALRKFVQAWSLPPLKDVTDWAPGDEGKTDHGFKLPPSLVKFEYEDLFAAGDPAGRRNVAGFLVALLHHAAPRGGWLQPVCRDLLLQYGDASIQPGFDLRELAVSPATGPLGESLLAWLGIRGAAGEGLNRLAVRDFRNDFGPLLAGDSTLSKLVLSLAEAARTLDEDELRAVAALVEDAYTCEMLTTLLVSLKAQSDRPVADALAAALDEVWKQGLSDYLKVLLEAQLAAEKARLSQVLYPKTTTPKITPIEQPTPLSDQLKGLEALEEELKAARGNQADTPLTDALKRLEDQKKR